MAMEQVKRRIEIFSQAILLRATVHTHRRMSEFINDGDPFLTLEDVEAWPYLADASIDLERHGHGLISKGSIVLVAELDTVPREVPAGLYVPKTPDRVLVYTDRFAIDGQLHRAPQVTVDFVISETRANFMPLTQATITPISTRARVTRFQRGFVMINREHISYIGAAEGVLVTFRQQAPPPTAEAEPARKRGGKKG
jgi:hypothetical protein